VEVITGLIKANVPTRITFQVSSQVDSRTVIDTSGAEKLLGAGDMLFMSAKTAKITRIQAPYISEKEVINVANYIVDQGKKVQDSYVAMEQSLAESLEKSEPGKDGEGAGEFFGEAGEDPLFEEVKKIVIETKKASASFLQRRLRIGYSRAARLIDMLEEQGIVGPADGAKPREVYGDSGVKGQTRDSITDIDSGAGDESDEIRPVNQDADKKGSEFEESDGDVKNWKQV
jgi:S-DNA-T family DNA segregation ATPase FtsK/SpoIIIE